MKKSILFFACASMLAGSASAQDVVTLFNQGKDAIAKYDKMEADFQLAKVKDPNAADVTATERANLIVEAVDILNKALPLDTIIEVDKKTGEPKIDKKTGQPKFKVKYSKEIQDLLVSHIPGLGSAGDAFFQANEFEKAYSAYGAYAKALKSDLAKERGYVVPDKDFGNILFMQGYAAFQIKNYASGYELTKKAMELGFDQYGVGDVRNACIANIVQNYVNDKKFDEANAYVDKLIPAENNGFIYDIKGFVVEQEKGHDAAAEYFKKSMGMGFGNAYFDYGRCLVNKAKAYIDANPDKNDKELAPVLIPLFEEAASVLREAKEKAPDSQAASLLDNIEYQLENLKNVK